MASMFARRLPGSGATRFRYPARAAIAIPSASSRSTAESIRSGRSDAFVEHRASQLHGLQAREQAGLHECIPVVWRRSRT